MHTDQSTTESQSINLELLDQAWMNILPNSEHLRASGENSSLGRILHVRDGSEHPADASENASSLVTTEIRGLETSGNSLAVRVTTNHSTPTGDSINHSSVFKSGIDISDEDDRRLLWSIYLYNKNLSSFDVKTLGKLSNGMSRLGIRDVALCARWFNRTSDKTLRWSTIFHAVSIARTGISHISCEEDMDQKTKDEIVQMVVQEAGVDEDKARLGMAGFCRI